MALIGRPPHATYTAPMLDHVVLNVSDYDRSRTFYEQALAPVGFSLLMEPRPGAGGFGTEGKPSFWISDQRRPVSENVHVAFTVQDRATVGAFHAAAVQAGVEALRKFGVELRGLEGAECRQDVDPDQVVVALASGVLQRDDLEPAVDRLAHGDVGLWVLVLVDLALKPGEGLRGLVVGTDRLADVPRPAIERVGVGLVRMTMT